MPSRVLKFTLLWKACIVINLLRSKAQSPLVQCALTGAKIVSKSESDFSSMILRMFSSYFQMYWNCQNYSSASASKFLFEEAKDLVDYLSKASIKMTRNCLLTGYKRNSTRLSISTSDSSLLSLNSARSDPIRVFRMSSSLMTMSI